MAVGPLWNGQPSLHDENVVVRASKGRKLSDEAEAVRRADVAKDDRSTRLGHHVHASVQCGVAEPVPDAFAMAMGTKMGLDEEAKSQQCAMKRLPDEGTYDVKCPVGSRDAGTHAAKSPAGLPDGEMHGGRWRISIQESAETVSSATVAESEHRMPPKRRHPNSFLATSAA